MKSQYILTLSVSLIAFVTGCKPSSDSSSANSLNDSQVQRAKADLQGTGQATQDYASKEKEQFVSTMNTEISKLKAQSSELESKVESCTGSTKDGLRARLELLRQKVDGLNDQLNKVRNSKGGSWNDVKSALEKANAEAKDSFTEARQWLSDKIKP